MVNKYRKMNVKFKRARHLHHPISWPSLGLQSYNLAWANACPNPDHTPIWSQIGKEMTDKSPILWALKQISKDSDGNQIEAGRANILAGEGDVHDLNYTFIVLYLVGHKLRTRKKGSKSIV